MATRQVGRFRSLLPPRSVAYAVLRAACSRYRLPPGDVGDIEQLEKSDRYYLLHQTSQFGPIFKGKGTNQLWVCIIGLDRCRRFLQAHARKLQGYMHDLEPMVPKGALRKMEGDDHRKYRKALVSGIHVQDLFRDEGPLNEIAVGELAKFAASQQESVSPASSYRGALTAIATASLVKLFFGVTEGTPLFDALVGGYYKLGPYGVVWNIGKQQQSAFAEISSALREALNNENGRDSGPFANSIVGKLFANNKLDDTLLGNLIYMVEMGRYDLAGLLRWLTRYAAAHPAFVKRIANETKEEADGDSSFAKAFVLETLRTDKSERLTRIAQRDLMFEGYLIPRHTYVRLCLWESHHSAESFERPFDFAPDRFVRSTFGADQFSPFGMDHHSCPLGDVAIGLGIVFLRNLSCNYRLESVGDGLSIRGAYHWEPAIDFGVRLLKRGDSQT
jgi:cytochrome P450